MIYNVFKTPTGLLITTPIDSSYTPYECRELGYTIVGQFCSDCACDYVRNMVAMNIKEGRCDPYLVDIEESIKRDGI